MSEENQGSPEKIKHLSRGLAENIDDSLHKFTVITAQSKILALNATVEASRAGDTGKSFAVVANEMKKMSMETQRVALSLEQNVRQSIEKLEDISESLSFDVKGIRFSDLALTNVDLIDRNLFERSCDVRWWSADISLIDALSHKDQSHCDTASQRMNIILQAYTVYFDIVLCDVNGKVVANGNSGNFSSVGEDCSEEQWFQQSLKSRRGDEFGFQGVHKSPLVGGQHILTYSSSVRTGDVSRGEVVGVIGVLFDWESLAQNIVKDTPIEESEKGRTRVCITDDLGNVLADTEGMILKDKLNFRNFGKFIQSDKNYAVEKIDSKPCLIAHAKAPGYESYTTGWHSFIIQKL